MRLGLGRNRMSAENGTYWTKSIDRSMTHEAAGVELTWRTLARAKRRALRQRCWYRALNMLERGIVDLTIRCVEEVKSSKLRTALTKILVKLAHSFGPGYLAVVATVGRPLAARISWLVQFWGNMRAEEWKDDTAFIIYLGADALSPETCHVSGLGRQEEKHG